MIKWIDGKKTYIGMIVLGGFGLAKSLGYEIPTAFWVIVSTWTGVSIRHAISKSER